MSLEFGIFVSKLSFLNCCILSDAKKIIIIGTCSLKISISHRKTHISRPVIGNIPKHASDPVKGEKLRTQYNNCPLLSSIIVYWTYCLPFWETIIYYYSLIIADHWNLQAINWKCYFQCQGLTEQMVTPLIYNSQQRKENLFHIIINNAANLVINIIS